MADEKSIAVVADTFQQGGGAFRIGEASLNPLAVRILHTGFAMVVAEVEFRRVALKMLRADMVKRA